MIFRKNIFCISFYSGKTSSNYDDDDESLCICGTHYDGEKGKRQIKWENAEKFNWISENVMFNFSSFLFFFKLLYHVIVDDVNFENVMYICI